MMALFSTHTSPSRRSFSVGQLVRHFGQYGTGPNVEDDVGAVRSIEEYVPSYLMKKCRSHTSIAQAESSLGAEESENAFTSAPENALCVIAADRDADCCAKDSSADAACCCQPVVSAHLRHSTTSSTVISSLSGACSPPQPDRVTSKTDSSTARCRGAILDRDGHHSATAVAAQPEAAAEQASLEDCGSDLMGAFGVLTADQWSALQSAVSDGETARPNMKQRQKSRTYGAEDQTAGHGILRASGAGLQAHPTECGCCSPSSEGSPLVRSPTRAPPRQQQSPCPSPASPSPQATLTDGNSVRQGSNPAACRRSAEPATGNSEGPGEDRASPGGSVSSIASLWAAVNSAVGSGVYDSTDDNILAGQRPGSDLRLPSSLTASRAPIVPRNSVDQPGQHQLPHAHASDQTATPPLQQQQQRPVDAPYLPFRHTHAEGLAAAPFVAARGSPDLLVLPGSPTAAQLATRSASCFAGSHFAQARNHMLQYGYFSHDPGQSADAALTQMADMARAHSRNSIDVGYYYQPPAAATAAASSCQGPTVQQQQQQQQHHYQQQQQQAAQMASSAPAHSQQAYPPQESHLHPHSHPHQRHLQHNHSYHLQRSPVHSQHSQSHLQAHLHPQPCQQAAPQVQLGSPSSRRGSALGMTGGQASYTTYGYRRAQSSLAALEQGYPHRGAVGGGDQDCSSSDDDTEEATRRITAAFRTQTGMARNSGWGLLGSDTAPTTPTADPTSRRDPWASVLGHGASNLGGGRGDGGVNSGNGALLQDGEAVDEAEGAVNRKRSGYHLTNSHAAVELFLRLNHARQTMDFVKRQTLLFANLDKAELTMWEALHMLGELREYEAVLMAEGCEAQEVASLSLLDHAFQTAELCRLHHPELDWLHLVGLIHGLGKLLAHRKFGSQPQWAICGETFPLGCRFSSYILGSQYFTANPDRRRRLYNSPTGLYGPGCGLLNVVMSWSAPEYLYLVLMLNSAPLPQEAVWVLRHAKFLTLTRPHSCYMPLCSADDLRRLPLLRSFQQLAAFRRVDLPEGFGLRGEERTAYYTDLINKYIGEGKLRW